MRASKLLFIASIAVAKLSIGQGYPSAEELNAFKSSLIQSNNDDNVRSFLRGALFPEAPVQTTFSRQENLAQLGLSQEARSFLYEYEEWKNAQESAQKTATPREFFDIYETNKGPNSLRPVISQILPALQRAATFQSITNSILDDQIQTAKNIDWNFRARNPVANPANPGGLSDLDITLYETIIRVGQEYVQANYGEGMSQEKKDELDRILAEMIKENTAEGETPKDFKDLTPEQQAFIQSHLVKRIGEALFQNAAAKGQHEDLLKELEKTTDLKIQQLTEFQRANPGLNPELVKQLRDFVAEYDPTMLNTENTMPPAVVAESATGEAGARQIATLEEKFVEEKAVTPLSPEELKNYYRELGLRQIKMHQKARAAKNRN